MNVILTPNQFNIQHIYFYDPIENTIMDNSEFIKLVYSTNDFICNGIYLLLNINITSKENYFKKIKYNFDINNNKELLKNIRNIEQELLSKYNILDKTKKFNINDSINTGSLKIYPPPDNIKVINNFILKISGIWENKNEYGLTFKILPVS
jgi:hypothetical protein|uniref:Uncharacterized protein n=1 Tax=viral metagenome TaxID=1070528 RepID=A0A6C0CIT6_9ZZZZ